MNSFNQNFFRENNQNFISHSENINNLVNIINKSNKSIKQNELSSQNSFKPFHLSNTIKDGIFKILPYSKISRKIEFNQQTEEYENIEEINKSFNNSNRKLCTPKKRNTKSYKKTKEHVKTPFKSTKSKSSIIKSQINIKPMSKNNFVLWKSLLPDEYMDSSFENDYLDEHYYTERIENPYLSKNNYIDDFQNYKDNEDDDEDNKSI